MINVIKVLIILEMNRVVVITMYIILFVTSTQCDKITYSCIRKVSLYLVLYHYKANSFLCKACTVYMKHVSKQPRKMSNAAPSS